MGLVLGHVLPSISCAKGVESPGRDDHLGRCSWIIRHCACPDGQRLALADHHREWTARSVDALSESRVASSASGQNHVYSVGDAAFGYAVYIALVRPDLTHFLMFVFLTLSVAALYVGFSVASASL